MTMLHKIATTGLLLAAMAYILRHVSSDDAPSWWVAVVVFIFASGWAMFFVGSLLEVWL